MDNLITWGIWLAFLAASYLIGTYREKAHFARIVEREKALVGLPALSMKQAEERPVIKSELVMGNVVVAGDYFKQLVAGLASIFGMRISVAEAMMDRARREAVLRMKEKAAGASAILNVRVESTKIGERNQITGVEALAFGTAVYYADEV